MMTAKIPSHEWSKEALVRAEQMIESLRNLHLREGWKFDEEGAARVLRYFRGRDARTANDHEDEEWEAVVDFIATHGQSFDWVMRGDPGNMICEAALAARAPRSGCGMDGWTVIEEGVCDIANMAILAEHALEHTGYGEDERNQLVSFAVLGLEDRARAFKAAFYELDEARREAAAVGSSATPPPQPTIIVPLQGKSLGTGPRSADPQMIAS